MREFIKAFFEIYNWRFWWFCFIAFLPVWAGIVGCAYVGIKEKLGGFADEK